jgi:D-tagatose-bisphosphate aldolase class II non-catalytic subunit
MKNVIAASCAGQHSGIPSYCTAHPETLLAILRCYRDNSLPILIEATCNQVNQDGGYTGMTPNAFREFIYALARHAGVDSKRIILGGDHLGPNPWKNLPANAALAKASVMVREYVEAGFTKIHLDASMACSDDEAFSENQMADRAAALCAVAEAHRGSRELCYVIGTEVPVPGGETGILDCLVITKPEAALQTFELHRIAFARLGLGQAFKNVIGIVVQPGVDFSNSQIFHYDKALAQPLSAVTDHIPNVAFEAHSTDYQTGQSLYELVASRFSILKVGPELTGAFREAVVAMSCIEERFQPAEKSRILEVIVQAMNANPNYWRGYIADDARADLMKIFGLSDRIRYYWANPNIQNALKQLRANIDSASNEIGLIAQFAKLAPRHSMPLSDEIIQARVGAVVAKYLAAC